MKGSLCQLAETSFLWRDTAMRIRERFNPRAPCGARLKLALLDKAISIFQPTRPLRGATGRPIGNAACPDFNPRAPCGARRGVLNNALGEDLISTHAPLAGRDEEKSGTENWSNLFQPTRPLRGATDRGNAFGGDYSDFNPRAPCEARQSTTTLTKDSRNFNPRAPCEARLTPPKTQDELMGISTHAPLARRDG